MHWCRQWRSESFDLGTTDLGRAPRPNRSRRGMGSRVCPRAERRRGTRSRLCPRAERRRGTSSRLFAPERREWYCWFAATVAMGGGWPASPASPSPANERKVEREWMCLVDILEQNLVPQRGSFSGQNFLWRGPEARPSVKKPFAEGQVRPSAKKNLA